MNQWTSLLTRKGRDALQDALSKKKMVEVELQVPSMRLRIRVSTQRAAPVWKVPMVLRLGVGAQVQIALALLEKDKERRNLCGRSGFDRSVYRSPKAADNLRTADCQDQRGRTKRDYRQVSRSWEEKGK